MDDSSLKTWLKWAMLGVGRTVNDVSRGLGFPPNYLHERFAVQEIVTKEFLESVLGEMGYTLGDFFSCVEGRLGDPRIHLARIQKTAEGPRVWPSVFPSVKRSKNPKKPPIDIWDLDSKRFEISLRRTAKYAGWYACFGETRAERCEGWAVLGIAQREKAALKHAAYCFLKALELCEVDSKQHALIYRRMSYLLIEVREVELADAALRRALEILVINGDMEFLGRVFVDFCLTSINRGEYSGALLFARRAIDLTADSWHQFAAHQGAGLCFLELGDPTEALRMADFCRIAGDSDREVFYGQYLYARCLVALERWAAAIQTLQKATNVASYDGIFLGDQLELEVVNIRCHLEISDISGAQLGIERFRRIALLVSRKFADLYSTELNNLIARRDVESLVKLQNGLLKRFSKYRKAV